MSIRVYWLDSRRVDPAQVWTLMSEKRRRKIESIRTEDGKRQSAAAELALVLAMAQEKGTAPQTVEWHLLPGGKPALDGGPHFSLSHAGDIAVCAVYEQPVGVDAERPREFPVRLRRKLLSEREQSYPDDRLLWTWVAKESFVKLTGEGLQRSMAGFSACEGEIQDENGKYLACVQTVPVEWPDYTLCVCTYEKDEVQAIGLHW